MITILVFSDEKLNQMETVLQAFKPYFQLTSAGCTSDMKTKPCYSLLLYLIFISAYEGNTVLKIFEPFKIYPGRNITTVQTPGGHHDISGHKAAGCWLGISPLGFIGTLVNSFVLLMFVQERDTLFTGVNIMIW